MNSMLKEKLDFVIRVVKEHGYKIKILKNKEKPKHSEASDGWTKECSN